jgi:hypothetical protein
MMSLLLFDYAAIDIGEALRWRDEYTDRTMTKNWPENPVVTVVAIQRFFTDLHIVGLPCFTDRRWSVIGKSGSLLVSRISEFLTPIPPQFNTCE